MITTLSAALLFVGSAHAAFPGANGKIAFLGDMEHGNEDIWSINPDGTVPTDLTNSSASGTEDEPAWSPDGTKIAFARHGYPYWWGIWVMNVDGTGLSQLTAPPDAYTDNEPSWSPDGESIVFESNREGASSYAIYVMNADGSGQRKLVDTPSNNPAPAWSPDGSKIAFYSGYGIHTIHPDATGEIEVTQGADRFPDWSPDGTKILFERSGIPNGTFVVNADGSEERLVIPGPQAWDPVWSPDGTKVAYSGSGAGDGDIWIANADGTGAMNLTNGSGGTVERRSPNWQPLPFNSVTRTFGAGGGTASTNPGTTPANPVGTAVTTPVGGTVSIDQASTTEPTPSGFSFLAWQVNISAPTTTADNPLALTFLIDSSLLPPGTDQTTLQVLKNDVLVPDCSGSAGVASPDPCVSGRTALSGGDVKLTILSSSASAWNFGIKTFEHPLSASPVTASLVPAFRRCGSGANTVSGAHASPLSVGSCAPTPTSQVALFGPQGAGSAQISAIGDNPTTPADESDLSVNGSLTDVRDLVTGLGYAPNPSGPDMRLDGRVRITDLASGSSGTKPATTVDLDLSFPIDCASAGPPAGSDCQVNTTVNSLVPGSIEANKSTTLQAFRLRIRDAGRNGVVGDGDDSLFAQQGVFAP